MAYYDPTMAALQGYPAAQSQGIEGLFSDRNFLSLLAGIGAGLDPKGVGGAIGAPTQVAIASMAAQDRAARQAAARNAQTKMVIDALNGYGGLTPKEEPGVTSLKATPTGVQMEVTPQQDSTGLGPPYDNPPVAPVAAPTVATPPSVGAAATTPVAPSVPSLGIGPQGVRPYTSARDRVNTLLPFYSALLNP